MAALTSPITPLINKAGPIAFDLLQRSQQLDAAEAAARQRAAANAASAEIRVADLRVDQAEAAARRRDTLRRAQARARARLSGQGVGAGGGSGAAVLQGLAAETARDAALVDREFDLRAANILQGVENSRQRDLLRLSDQRRRAQIATLRQGFNARPSINSIFDSEDL